MSLIIRTWGCQNKACLSVFDSDGANPACPRCGCVRVGWVPRRVNIGAVAKGVDSELRTLADLYGLSDLRSAREGEAVKKTPTPRPSSASGGGANGVVNFGGFAANINPAGSVTQNNQSGAQCLPTVNRFDVKVRPGMDSKLAGKLGLPGISQKTQVVNR